LLRSSPHDTPRRSTRAIALALAIGLLAQPLEAACAWAQAASPFPVVSVGAPRRQHHFGAYLALASGVTLVAGSFVLRDRANSTYDEYLVETDPDEITALYDRTTLYDRLSSVSLVTGELLIVGGLYLRFLRPEPSSRLSLSVGLQRCALAYSF